MSDSSPAADEPAWWKGHPISRVLISTLNFDLIQEAGDEFEEVNWYIVSLTTFHIGVVWLGVWSLIIISSLLLSHLMNSPSLIVGVNRAVTTISLFSGFLLLFAAASKRSASRLTEVSPPNSRWSRRIRWTALFVVSFTAIVIAAVFRWSMFTALQGLYGSTLNLSQTLIVMLIDSGYLSLLLVGIGGIGTLVYEPIDEN